MNRLYRHGDVLFEELDKAPDLHNPRTTDDEKAGVVKRGESSGHAHVIAVEDQPFVEIFSDWRDQFLKAEKDFAITHEEHGRLEIPAGVYRIHIAREFDYLHHAARAVID